MKTRDTDSNTTGSARRGRRFIRRVVGSVILPWLLASCLPPIAIPASDTIPAPAPGSPSAATPATAAAPRSGSAEGRDAAVARLPRVTDAMELPGDTELLRDRAGMLFALVPDPHSNLVRVDMRYRSGAADDPQGKEGLAHLVEHMTFHLRGAVSEPTLAQRLGQDALAFNAFTSWDETHFHATGLSDKVASLIAIEADRLAWGCDRLSETELAREQRVVARELETRRSSTSALFDRLRRAIYRPGHPYHRGVGGSPGRVAASTLADVCRFIDRGYRPANAIMVVSGGIDPAVVRSLLEDRYGSLSRVRMVEADRSRVSLIQSGTAGTIRGDVPTPGLFVLAEAPRWGSRNSARFFLALSLFRERLAQRVASDGSVIVTGPVALGSRTGGLHGVFIQVSDASALVHAAALVRDLFENPLAGLSDDAVVAARERFRAELLRHHDEIGVRAVSLADAVQNGHTRQIAGVLALVGELGRDDLEQANRRLAAQAHIIRVLPGGNRADDADDAGRIARSAIESGGMDPGDIERDAHRDPGISWRPPVDARDADRDVPMPRQRRGPGVVKTRLDNGLRVVLVPRPGYPMVYARLLFAGSPHDEPDDLEDLAELAVRLRRPGLTAPWSSGFGEDIAQVAQYPVDIAGYVESGATVFTGSSPSLHAPALLWNLGLQVRYGGYLGLSNVGKVMMRRHLRAIAARRRTSIEGIVRTVTAGGTAESASPDAANHSPDARELAALEATISRLQRRDLVAHAARRYRPENGTLIITGDFDARAMLEIIEEFFAGWRVPASPDDPAWEHGRKSGHEPERLAGSPARVTAGQRVLLVQPSRVQPRVVAIYPDVLEHTDDARAAALILRSIVEGRLTREVREVLEATYHVSISFQQDALVIDTTLGGPRARRAVAAVQTILDNLLDDRFRDDFVRARRKVLERALASSMSAATLMERATRTSLGGGANDPLDSLAESIARVRLAQVAALVEVRLRAVEPSVIIAAPRSMGLALFGVMGRGEPRIVE